MCFRERLMDGGSEGGRWQGGRKGKRERGKEVRKEGERGGKS